MNRDCWHCAKLTRPNFPNVHVLEYDCPELESMTDEEVNLANFGECPRWTGIRKVKQ